MVYVLLLGAFASSWLLYSNSAIDRLKNHIQIFDIVNLSNATQPLVSESSSPQCNLDHVDGLCGPLRPPSQCSALSNGPTLTHPYPNLIRTISFYKVAEQVCLHGNDTIANDRMIFKSMMLIVQVQTVRLRPMVTRSPIFFFLILVILLFKNTIYFIHGLLRNLMTQCL
jgi:hypothetical protein